MAGDELVIRYYSIRRTNQIKCGLLDTTPVSLLDYPYEIYISTVVGSLFFAYN